MKTQDADQADAWPVALTIAGSDSGGGAGIQADLKTFAAFGVFGTSAITCVTAQNPSQVSSVHAVEAEMVTRQIKAVCESFPISAAKTGMLYSAAIIRAVAAADVRQGIQVLVVDPVMVATSGARLLQPDAVDVLCAELLPQARVITPNLHEAEILCGHAITSVDALRAAAAEIGDRFDVACVVKGGHLPGESVVDVLYDEGEEFVFTAPRVEAAESHGSGCAFSAAITACMAHGMLLSDAVARAKEFVRQAIVHARPAGRHHPLNLLWDVVITSD
jgi:hydroxymethylpyrimidine kinase/phosphomethylpyrimidine kinase